MERTSVLLPDELAERLDAERRRRDISAAAVIREAVERYLPSDELMERYGFIALGEGDDSDIGARMEELLAEEWGNPAFDRDPDAEANPSHLPFIGIVDGGGRGPGTAEVEQYLHEHWATDILPTAPDRDEQSEPLSAPTRLSP